MNKRNISTGGLLFAAVSSILGSGWLFAAKDTASFAGPASIISWIIGTILMIIIAFVFAEICTMIPVVGSSTRIPQITHGRLISFVFAWIIWLSYLTFAPTEVQAVIQYFAFYFPTLIYHQTHGLTPIGIFWATFLLLIISGINAYSIRWLIRANSIITIFKMVIPVVVSGVILYVAYMAQSPVTHALVESNHQDMAFAPYGINGILSAISVGGIAFSYTGFKLAAELAGETKNPKRAIPIAIIGSIVLTLCIYLCLQVAYIKTAAPFVHDNNWQDITMGNAVSADLGPFANIAATLKLHWLTVVIYTGAIIGPLAAGLMYFSSATRSIYAMSKNGYLPEFFQKLTPTGNPYICIMVNFFVGLLMFMPLPGWHSMAMFLTSLLNLTYVMGPISLLALRKRCPDQSRPFRLKWGYFISLLAMFASTLMLYWTGWDIIWKAAVAIGLSIIILGIYQKIKARHSTNIIQWHIKQSFWLWGYLAVILVVSYLGPYGQGSAHVFGVYGGMEILFVLCVVVCFFATRQSLPAQTMQQNLDHALFEKPTN